MQRNLTNNSTFSCGRGLWNKFLWAITSVFICPPQRQDVPGDNQPTPTITVEDNIHSDYDTNTAERITDEGTHYNFYDCTQSSWDIPTEYKYRLHPHRFIVVCEFHNLPQCILQDCLQEFFEKHVITESNFCADPAVELSRARRGVTRCTYFHVDDLQHLALVADLEREESYLVTLKEVAYYNIYKDRYPYTCCADTGFVFFNDYHYFHKMDQAVVGATLYKKDLHGNPKVGTISDFKVIVPQLDHRVSFPDL